jgi:PEP-CTERM motif
MSTLTTGVSDQAWKRYVLASSALLASTSGLDAAVITSGPLNQTLNVTEGSDVLDFDFDSDGDTDLSVFAFDSTTESSFIRGVSAYGLGIALSESCECNLVAKAFRGGQVVGPDSNFYYYGYLLKDYLGQTLTQQALIGEWPNDISQFRFLGFQFLGSDEQLHYGWMKLAVQLGSADVNIVEWAYESEADVEIEITTPLPEPASMALMALGAAGVAALKRRRRNGSN